MFPLPRVESPSSAVCTAEAEAPNASGDVVVWPANSRSYVPLVATIVTVCTSSTSAPIFGSVSRAL